MAEPRAGDRIRHQGVEGVVTFWQSVPGMVHIGRALVASGPRYVVMQPDALSDEITIYEDKWPEIEILAQAHQD